MCRSLSTVSAGSPTTEGAHLREINLCDELGLECTVGAKRGAHLPRFMVACERCDGWFHPKCVGTTVAAVKRLEAAKTPFLCPSCAHLPVAVGPVALVLSLLFCSLHFFCCRSSERKGNPDAAKTPSKRKGRDQARDDADAAHEDAEEEDEEEP
jgi:hypothetical protein